MEEFEAKRQALEEEEKALAPWLGVSEETLAQLSNGHQAPERVGKLEQRARAVEAYLKKVGSAKRSELYTELQRLGIAPSIPDHLSPLLSNMKDDQRIIQDEYGLWKLFTT